MDNAEYLKNALLTEPLDSVMLFNRLAQKNTMRLLHASIGMNTESGEISDVIKRHVFYGKPIDKVNLIEEAGDLLWYLSVLLDALDSNFDEAMEKNISKLKARFGDKFTEQKALNRDLGKERQALEGVK